MRNLPFFVVVLALPPAAFLLLKTPWFYTDTAVTTGIFFILVMGLDLLYGSAGQLSLGHQGFFAIGAYVVAILFKHAGLSPWLGMLCGLALNVALALSLGRILLRLTGLHFMLGTLALGIIVHGIITVWHPVTGGDAGLGGVPRPSFLGVSLSSQMAFAVFVWGMALVLFWFALNVSRSRVGRALRAIRSDEVSAAANGISVMRLKANVFAVSAAYASIAGSLFAIYFGAVHPESFSLSALLDMLLMLFLGGEGTIWGGLLGATVLRLLPEVSGPLHAYKILFSGVVFTLILFLFPKGLAALFKHRKRPQAAQAAQPADLPAVSMNNPDGSLRVHDAVRTFGGLRAVDGVSFELGARRIKSLIGPNGAGKTTLLNAISGVYPVESGGVEFAGRQIERLRSDQIARLGLRRTFQNIRLFSELSVIENVMVGCDRGSEGTIMEFVRAALPTPGTLRREQALEHEARRWLRAVELDAAMDEPVNTLPYGHRKLVELVRAAAAGPALLLLDEAAAGLNNAEKQDFKRLIRRLRESGTTVLLVEHDMDFVMDLSDEVIVVNFGRKIADGSPDAVRRNPQVLEAYLGV
jgi:branched-chain amino acid transport system permease protein